MNTITILEKLVEYSKKYRTDASETIKRNSHMNDINENDVIDQRIVDAVLVDYINFIGHCHGIDYALYSDDIKNK